MQKQNKKNSNKSQRERNRIIKNRMRHKLAPSKGSGFSQILVPTDFSLEAKQAADYAASLADTFDSEVILYHVYQFLQSGTSVMINIDDLILETAQKGIKTELQRIKKNHPRIRIRGIYEEGFLPDGIKKTIQDENVDLLVMGTKGAQGFTRKFLGSNTSHILSQISIPLLVVPKNCTPELPKNIVLATDLLHSSKRSTYEPLRVFSDRSNTHLNIIHIIENEAPLNEQKSLPLLPELENLISHNKTNITQVRSNNIEEGIFDYLASHPVDLLTVVRREMGVLQRLLHKSISAAIVKNASTPVLVLCK